MKELKQIKSLVQQLDGYEFDVIVTFARGGLVASQYIAYALNIEGIIAVGSPKTLVPGYFHIQPTQRVLIVDDICDSGLTLIEAKSRLDKYRMGSHIKTAVLFKRHSSAFEPDFVGEVIEHDDYHLFSWDTFKEDM